MASCRVHCTTHMLVCFGLRAQFSLLNRNTRGQQGDLTHSVSTASGDAAVPYRAQQALKVCHRLGSEEARPPFPLAAQEAAQWASTAYHLDLLASSVREACPQIAPSKRSGRLAELDSADAVDAADAAGPEEDSE